MIEPDTPRAIASDVRLFEGDTWYYLVERSRSLQPHEQQRLFQYLMDEIKLADEEKQTRIIDLMFQTDRALALPYIDAIIRTTTSALVKVHVCWVLEGRVGASWIPTVSHLLLHDEDVEVRRAALYTLAFMHDPQADEIIEYCKQFDRGEFL